jgi:hypothetical protein
MVPLKQDDELIFVRDDGSTFGCRLHRHGTYEWTLGVAVPNGTPASVPPGMNIVKWGFMSVIFGVQNGSEVCQAINHTQNTTSDMLMGRPRLGMDQVRSIFWRDHRRPGLFTGHSVVVGWHSYPAEDESGVINHFGRLVRYVHTGVDDDALVIYVAGAELTLTRAAPSEQIVVEQCVLKFKWDWV